MKIRKLKKDSDYLVLKQWCQTICDYLLSIESGFSDIVEGEYGLMSILNDIDETHNLKKMKALYKEFNILIGEDMLTMEQMAELNQLLKEKFGHNLADEKDKESVMIRKLVKRGKIQTDKEFELVKRREEEIWQDDSQFDYAETLRHLMGDYERGDTGTDCSHDLR